MVLIIIKTIIILLKLHPNDHRKSKQLRINVM